MSLLTSQDTIFLPPFTANPLSAHHTTPLSIIISLSPNFKFAKVKSQLHSLILKVFHNLEPTYFSSHVTH